LDCLLDVLHAATFLFFEHASLFLKLLSALSSVSFESFLVHLVNAQFGQLKFALFILSIESNLLLLALQLSFVLIGKRMLVFTKLNLSLLLKTVLFLADELILLASMLSEASLSFGLQLDLVLRDFLVKHVATVLGINFNLLFHLG
jgi:hypothetical protein